MTGSIPLAGTDPHGVTAQEMRRLDYWATREFQLPVATLMEHAGSRLLDLLERRFGLKRGDAVLVLAGTGSNGGGVLAAARLLAHRGFTVSALTTEAPTKLQPEARRQLVQFRKEGGSAPVHRPDQPLPEAKFLLDGVLGYGHLDAPKGAARDFMAACQKVRCPIISLDVPSGVNPDSGDARTLSVRAAATLMLAFPKVGLLQAKARPYVGEPFLADVAFPRQLYADFGTTPEAVFGEEWIVRLRYQDARE